MRKFYTPDKSTLLQGTLGWLRRSLVSTLSLVASHKNTWKPVDNAKSFADFFWFSFGPYRVSLSQVSADLTFSVSFALSSPLPLPLSGPRAISLIPKGPGLRRLSFLLPPWEGTSQPLVSFISNLLFSKKHL